MKLKRTISLLLATFLCASSLFACGKNKTTEPPVENAPAVAEGELGLNDYNWMYGDDETMFTINGIPVDFATFRHYVMYNKAAFDSGDSSYWTEATQEEFFNLIKDEFKYYYGNLLLAKEKGIELSDDDIKYIDDQIKDIKDSIDAQGEVTFQQSLGEMFLTEQIYKNLVTYEFYIQELVESKVSEEEIANYITENYVTVQHVLISTEDEEGNALSEDAEAEKLKLANEVYSKAVAGEDFKSLINKYGEDPGMTVQDSYTFTFGQMVAEFEDASFELGVGEISKPIKSDFGYHIIKKLPLNTKETPTEDTTDYLNIVYELGYDKYAEEITEYMETLEVADTDAFKKITVSNIGTPKAAK